MPMDTQTVRQWVEAAKNDGWDVQPTYPNHEPVEKAARGEKDGWVFQAIMRGNKGDSLTVWGPDSLVVRAYSPYNWETLQEGLNHCNLCDADGVETIRYSFAGRCCRECASHPDHNKKYHFPGWCD